MESVWLMQLSVLFSQVEAVLPGNEKVKIALVIFVIPFIVNVSCGCSYETCGWELWVGLCELRVGL